MAKNSARNIISTCLGWGLACCAIPAAAQVIPSQTVISQRQTQTTFPEMWSDGLSSLTILSPTTTYDANSILNIKVVFSLNFAPTPSYDEEVMLLEFDGANSIPIAINSECVRSTNFKLLTCNFQRAMPPAVATKTSTSIRVRYYGWDATSTYTAYPNWTWQADLWNVAMKTMFCTGFQSTGACTPPSGGTSSGGSSSGGTSSGGTSGGSGSSGSGGTSGGGTSTSGGSSSNNAACTTENAPMMPTTIANGSFFFTLPVNGVCPGVFWIDPPVAAGFRFESSGAEFKSITMPSTATVADADGYSVDFPGTTIPTVKLAPGATYTPPSPVSIFMVHGINPALKLSTKNAQAFPTGTELTAPTGTVTIIQTPLTQDRVKKILNKI